MKNIPFTSKSEYTKRLIEKTESVLKRMRWKAFFFLNPEIKAEEKETYGFNSRKTPPQIDEMIKFEDDLLQLIGNIKFRKTNCRFQSNLQKDIRKIKNSDHLLIPADKTNNYYKLSRVEYEKLLKDNTTAKYTRTSNTEIAQINAEAKQIAKHLNLADRIETVAQRPAFITIKDHKDNFPNRVQCRLINPAKSDIGTVSKSILDRINKKLLDATKVQQWKNTQSTINWFSSISDKENSTFLVFDVVDFYPTISQDLLNSALDFASDFTTISEDDRNIIMHAKKTLLFHNGTPWHKSTPPHLFDVTMGSYDGAETCELTGTFLLNKIKHLFDNNVGLYRDDGLAVVHNRTPAQINRTAKQLIKIFQEHGLKITINQNIKIVNFLDVTLNLNDGSYRPYMKPNNITHYVHNKSNHPRSIIQSIPDSINKRLVNISSDETQYKSAVTHYQKALHQAGYKDELKFNSANPVLNSAPNRKNRSRNIIWFNPPFSKQVSTNIGRIFIQLIEKHFPKRSKLHKIFNRNTVKVSYSCMDNVGQIIKAHNKAIIDKNSETVTNMCNCRRPNECPLDGKCLTKGVIYQAKVTSNESTKIYIGASDTEFKTRWNNHKSSFNLEHKKKQTALSKHIWNLKESNTQFSINWSILKKARSYSNTNKRCHLCLWEKYFIITADQGATLNSRSELISKCRHSNKFLLMNTD